MDFLLRNILVSFLLVEHTPKVCTKKCGTLCIYIYTAKIEYRIRRENKDAWDIFSQPLYRFKKSIFRRQIDISELSIAFSSRQGHVCSFFQLHHPRLCTRVHIYGISREISSPCSRSLIYDNPAIAAVYAHHVSFGHTGDVTFLSRRWSHGGH